LENKKPPDFANEEWRKFDEPAKTVGRTGLILLFAEKRPGRGADECNQTGILTSASILTPAFPSLRSVALRVCSHYSGATVPEFHRVPRHLTAMSGITSASFKERSFNYAKKKKIQAKFLPRVRLASKLQHSHNVASKIL